MRKIICPKCSSSSLLVAALAVAALPLPLVRHLENLEARLRGLLVRVNVVVIFLPPAVRAVGGNERALLAHALRHERLHALERRDVVRPRALAQALRPRLEHGEPLHLKALRPKVRVRSLKRFVGKRMAPALVLPAREAEPDFDVARALQQPVVERAYSARRLVGVGVGVGVVQHLEHVGEERSVVQRLVVALIRTDEGNVAMRWARRAWRPVGARDRGHGAARAGQHSMRARLLADGVAVDNQPRGGGEARRHRGPVVHDDGPRNERPDRRFGAAPLGRAHDEAQCEHPLETRPRRKMKDNAGEAGDATVEPRGELALKHVVERLA
mmetsp:Transcript_11641/g.36865  ORF Transcript_11641/g.36865 Transcript_11641/m.36865 type:complete len:327 (-) Transcript_11641:589-1569(-)